MKKWWLFFLLAGSVLAGESEFSVVLVDTKPGEFRRLDGNAELCGSTKGFLQSLPCHINVAGVDSCHPQGVAMLNSDVTIWFTNNTAGDKTWRMVTKKHCLPGAVAGQIFTLPVDFDYQSDTPDNPQLEPEKKRVIFEALVYDVSAEADRVCLVVQNFWTEDGRTYEIQIEELGWTLKDPVKNSYLNITGHPVGDIKKTTLGMAMRVDTTAFWTVQFYGNGALQHGNSASPAMFNGFVYGDVSSGVILDCPEPGQYNFQSGVKFNKISADWQRFCGFFDNANTGTDSLGSRIRILRVGPRLMSGVTSERALVNFHLSQNHPNPFNPTTTISYALTRPSQVKLTVFNMLGNVVAILVNERQLPGEHRATFNASNLPAGAYFYCLEAEGMIETKKMVLVK